MNAANNFVYFEAITQVWIKFKYCPSNLCKRMHVGVNGTRFIGTNMENETQFFHVSGTARKRVTHIISLEDNQGVKVTDNSYISTLTKNYVMDLF